MDCCTACQEGVQQNPSQLACHIYAMDCAPPEVHALLALHSEDTASSTAGANLLGPCMAEHKTTGAACQVPCSSCTPTKAVPSLKQCVAWRRGPEDQGSSFAGAGLPGHCAAGVSAVA